jgi:endoglucanase
MKRVGGFMRKGFLAWIVLAGLLSACNSGSTSDVEGGPTASATLSRDFLPALGEVPNPERGFAGDSYYPDEPSLDAEAKVAEARSRGFEIRLIRRTYYLHAFADQDTLPTAFLNTLAQDLASAQAAGVKLILRFAYRPDENSPSGPTYCDPPEERILAHLEKLGPVLRANRGVIAYLEAGLIGPWGE